MKIRFLGRCCLHTVQYGLMLAVLNGNVFDVYGDAESPQVWWSDVAGGVDELIEMSRLQLEEGVVSEELNQWVGTNTSLRLEYARMLMAKSQEQDDPMAADKAIEQFHLALEEESPQYTFGYLELSSLYLNKAFRSEGNTRIENLMAGIEVLERGILTVSNDAAGLKHLLDKKEEYSEILNKVKTSQNFQHWMSHITGERPADYDLPAMDMETFNKRVYSIRSKSLSKDTQEMFLSLRADVLKGEATFDHTLEYLKLLIKKGYGQNRADQLKEAYGILQELNASHPEHVDVLSGFAFYYAAIRHYEESLDMLRRAKSIAPDSSSVRFVQGEILEMREIFRYAAELDVKDPQLKQIHQKRFENLNDALQKTDIEFPQMIRKK